MFVNILSGITLVVCMLAFAWTWWQKRKRTCSCGHLRSEHKSGVIEQPAELKGLVPVSYWYEDCTAQRRYGRYTDGVRKYRNCSCTRYDALVGGR